MNPLSALWVFVRISLLGVLTLSYNQIISYLATVKLKTQHGYCKNYVFNCLQGLEI